MRTQEADAAVFSPALYSKFVRPVDRMLAGHFASSLIHLYSASMFLLEACLEIEEIKCLEIINDASVPPLARTVPHFQRVQTARRLLRGDMTPKPAYEALMRLVKGKWWTRTEVLVSRKGCAQFRGFYGEYRVTAQEGGREISGTFILDARAPQPIGVRMD